MRKIFLLFITALITFTSFAQKKKKTYNLGNRAADHIMVQLSYDHWLGMPDSISSHAKGFSRGLNIYGMIDKPFHGNPKFSVAFGIGIGSSSTVFKKMFVDISSANPTVPFINQDSTNNFKKFKLSTSFVEIPLEFRFSSNPENPNKSTKFAIGIKGGTMLNAHTKAKQLRDAAGKTLIAATFKESTKSYFNTTRLVATARVGYGIFSLFGAYNITPVFKDGVASPDIRTLQVGLTISGL